jgi:hypothetical protein
MRHRSSAASGRAASAAHASAAATARRRVAGAADVRRTATGTADARAAAAAGDLLRDPAPPTTTDNIVARESA